MNMIKETVVICGFCVGGYEGGYDSAPSVRNGRVTRTAQRSFGEGNFFFFFKKLTSLVIISLVFFVQFLILSGEKTERYSSKAEREIFTILYFFLSNSISRLKNKRQTPTQRGKLSYTANMKDF